MPLDNFYYQLPRIPTKKLQRLQWSSGKVQREHHLEMKPLRFHVPPFTHPFYIHFGKLLRQKVACQSSFQVTLHGQFAIARGTGNRFGRNLPL